MRTQWQLLAFMWICGVHSCAGSPPHRGTGFVTFNSSEILLGKDVGRRWLPRAQQEYLSPPHAVAFVQVTEERRGRIGNLLQRAADFITRRNLVTEEETQAAIDEHVRTKDGLNLGILSCTSYPSERTRKKVDRFCNEFPRGSQLISLCHRLEHWLLQKLDHLKTSCKSGVAECLQQLRLPLTQTALVGLYSDEGDDELYKLRRPDLPQVDLSVLYSGEDAVSPLFKETVGASFSVSVYGQERVEGIVRAKQVSALPPERRHRLLLSLLAYFLLDLRSIPLVDPMLITLLLRLTTSGCGRTEKRKVEVEARGRKRPIKVKGKRVMLVAWSELIKHMVGIGDCSSSSSAPNCVLLTTFLHWQQQVTEQLNKVSVGQGDEREADPKGDTNAAEHTQADEKLHKLAAKVLRRVERTLLLVNSMMQIKFKWLINFLGNHKSSRNLLLKVAKKLANKTFGLSTVSKKAEKDAKKLAMPLAARYGIVLFYKVQKEGEVLVSTGKQGLGKLVGQLVRTTLKQMWGLDTDIKAKKRNGQSLIQKASKASTVVSFRKMLQASGKPVGVRWIPRHSLHFPCDSRFVRQMKAYIFPGNFSHCDEAHISLIQTGTGGLSNKLVTGGAGLAAIIFGISGVVSGGISMIFPALFIIGGLCLCLYSVISSLQDLGIVPRLGDHQSAGTEDHEPLDEGDESPDEELIG
ncbi:putative transmembrane protein [Toxoplasma gondii p89]|uniref:Putative transmembrane protein n=1 Tax=Toxoplasma gondii p89 TaxID=943119 RepID=A0A086KET9_TOXGO|nr:putative transmembrane protein [Toxoplasma gondii p89]